MHTNSTYEKVIKPFKRPSTTFKQVKTRQVWERTDKRLKEA